MPYYLASGIIQTIKFNKLTIIILTKSQKTMQEIKFYSGENIPLELHKVRIVQKLNLVPIERRLQALFEGGFNTFELSTRDVTETLLRSVVC